MGDKLYFVEAVDPPGFLTAGERIRAARLARGISLREMARRLRISPSYLCDIETDRRVPAEDLLLRLAAILDFVIDDLGAAFGRLSPNLLSYLAAHPQDLAALRQRARQWASKGEQG